VLAFGLTWAVWVPRAASVPLDFVGQAWTWIPAVAALLAAALTGGRPALRDLGSRLVRWRVGWPWYLVVILGPAVFSLAWRGFALPRLLVRHNAPIASLILGVLWALWHLPLVWTEGASMYHRPV
jgi:membrane protease YdiL (CAAX protease family)